MNIVDKQDESDKVVVLLKKCRNDPGTVCTIMIVKIVNEEAFQSDYSSLNSFKRNPTKRPTERKISHA